MRRPRRRRRRRQRRADRAAPDASLRPRGEEDGGRAPVPCFPRAGTGARPAVGSDQGQAAADAEAGPRRVGQVESSRCCLRPGPGTRSAVFPNVKSSPVVRGEAKPGRRPGPASARRAPCCRSRSGNPNTRQVRSTARTWRIRAHGIGTGTSGLAWRRRHKSDGLRRRPCPRSRPCASAAARPVLFKSPCPAFSPAESRSAQLSLRAGGRNRPAVSAISTGTTTSTVPK